MSTTWGLWRIFWSTRILPATASVLKFVLRTVFQYSNVFNVFIHLGSRCLLQEALPNTVLNSKQEATIFRHGMKSGESANEPLCMRCRLLSKCISEWPACPTEASKYILSACHCVTFLLDTSRKRTQENLHILFFLLITAACPPLATPRFLRRLICPLRAPTPTYHMRWKDQWRSRTLVRGLHGKKLKQNRSTARILSRIFIFQYFLWSPCRPGADPWWWMIIIYSTKPDIYLMWLHLV